MIYAWLPINEIEAIGKKRRNGWLSNVDLMIQAAWLGFSNFSNH